MSVILSFNTPENAFCSESSEVNIANIRQDLAIIKQFKCIEINGSHRYNSSGICLYCGANGADESAVLVDGATFKARVTEAMPSGGTAQFVSSSTLVDDSTYPTKIDLTDPDSIYMVYGYVNSEKTAMLIKAESYGLKANEDCSTMFSGSTITYTSLDQIDVSSVVNASNMFNGNTNLGAVTELANWDVSAITNMTSMFENCTELTDISGLSGWVTSAVQNISAMFSGCIGLTNLTGLNSLIISNVQNTYNMFGGCTALADISAIANWDVSNISVMDAMFSSIAVTDFSILDEWNVVSETYTTSIAMFGGTTVVALAPVWLILPEAVCLLDDGTTFRDTVVASNVNIGQIKFHINSTETSDMVLSTSDSTATAYGVIETDAIATTAISKALSILHIHTIAPKFTLNEDCSYMFGSNKFCIINSVECIDESLASESNVIDISDAIDGSTVSSIAYLLLNAYLYADAMASFINNISKTNLLDMNNMFSSTKYYYSLSVSNYTPVIGTGLSSLDMTGLNENVNMDGVLGSTYASGSLSTSSALSSISSKYGRNYSGADNWEVPDKYKTTLDIFGSNTYITTYPAWMTARYSSQLADGDTILAQIKSLAEDLSNVYFLKFVTNASLSTNVTTKVTETDSDKLFSESLYPNKTYTGTAYIGYHTGTYSGVTKGTITIYTSADRFIFPESCKNMFNGLTNLASIKMSNETDVLVSNRTTDLSYMFSDCSSIDSEDLINMGISTWDVSNVTTIENIFDGCTSLTDASALESWDTSALTTTTDAFPAKCTTLPSWYSAA